MSAWLCPSDSEQLAGPWQGLHHLLPLPAALRGPGERKAGSWSSPNTLTPLSLGSRKPDPCLRSNTSPASLTCRNHVHPHTAICYHVPAPPVTQTLKVQLISPHLQEAPSHLFETLGCFPHLAARTPVAVPGLAPIRPRAEDNDGLTDAPRRIRQAPSSKSH